MTIGRCHIGVIYARPYGYTGRSLFVVWSGALAHCALSFHPANSSPPHEQCLSRAHGPDRKDDLPAISEGSIVRSPIVTGISCGRARSRQWEPIGKSYVCVICISRVARRNTFSHTEDFQIVVLRQVRRI